jgi:hypothetical protein
VNVQTPTQQAAQQFDMWANEWKTAMREKQREAAAAIFADPVSLALVVSEAIDEDPIRFGAALQALAKGDSFQLAALATAAVYEACSEKLS